MLRGRLISSVWISETPCLDYNHYPFEEHGGGGGAAGRSAVVCVAGALGVRWEHVRVFAFVFLLPLHFLSSSSSVSFFFSYSPSFLLIINILFFFFLFFFFSYYFPISSFLILLIFSYYYYNFSLHIFLLLHLLHSGRARHV